jgi:hypothetical protein
MKADYLAIGESPLWNKCDYNMKPFSSPLLRPIQEMYYLWKIAARYEIVHCHFMITLSERGWELPFLKKAGVGIVIHFRGCEIRDKNLNMSLNPDFNMCEMCDYDERCMTDAVVKKREKIKRLGDVFLVTTPDLKDFIPEAEHLLFFIPELPVFSHQERGKSNGEEIRILHVTGHPGLEGTSAIKSAVDSLKAKGYPIEFIFLNCVSHDTVLKELANADITIGKMKMGYYANFQIESMLLGVPAVTYVRPEFMTKELQESGFIFCNLIALEEILQHYLDNPDKLQAKKAIAKSSILKLHDNEKIARQLISIYQSIKRDS